MDLDNKQNDIYFDSIKVNIDINEEISFYRYLDESTQTIFKRINDGDPANFNEASENFKNSLLANLYSTVDHLKKELEAKNIVIANLFDQLQHQTSIQQKLVETRLNYSSSSDSSNTSEECINIENNTFQDCSSIITDNNEIITINHDQLNETVDDTNKHSDSIINIVANDSTAKNKTLRIKATIKDQLRDYSHDKFDDYQHFLQQHISPNTENFIDEYQGDTNDKIPEFNIKRVENVIKTWPGNTVLITGSSILNGIEENRLSKSMNVKVRPFSGAYVDDMYDYLLPLLKKCPSYIILQIGSNDAPLKTAKQIFNEITDLKAYILSVLPTVKVFLSCPVLRLDDAKANLTLRQLSYELKGLPDVIINENVDGSCLGKKGLHLNPKGSGRLAINFISLMRRL